MRAFYFYLEQRIVEKLPKEMRPKTFIGHGIGVIVAESEVEALEKAAKILNGRPVHRSFSIQLGRGKSTETLNLYKAGLLIQ